MEQIISNNDKITNKSFFILQKGDLLILTTVNTLLTQIPNFI
jgi:hypothetical protein